MTDLEYMKRAMALALRGKGETSPNPAVGALIVKGGRIIAEGWHKRCGGDHAEIMALKGADSRARNAKMYVTLEPCTHFGRTPPCVDQIIASGIKEVVIGTQDPNPVNQGKSLTMLKKAGIKTKLGFLTDELNRMNEAFIKYITHQMPFVVAKSAQTVDGKIATYRGESHWITSVQTRDFSHHMRDEFDAILVGINTVLKDNPYLNAAKSTHKIKKIVVDSTLKIPLDANLFKKTDAKNIFLATTQKANPEKLNQLTEQGVSVMICPEDYGRVDLSWLFAELAQREITYILIEGGSEIIGGALQKGLVDKFLIFIAPKIMGDHRALNSVVGLDMDNINACIPLSDMRMRKLGEDILIEAYVHRDN